MPIAASFVVFPPIVLLSLPPTTLEPSRPPPRRTALSFVAISPSPHETTMNVPRQDATDIAKRGDFSRTRRAGDAGPGRRVDVGSARADAERGGGRGGDGPDGKERGVRGTSSLADLSPWWGTVRRGRDD